VIWNHKEGGKWKQRNCPRCHCAVRCYQETALSSSTLWLLCRDPNEDTYLCFIMYQVTKWSRIVTQCILLDQLIAFCSKWTWQQLFIVMEIQVLHSMSHIRFFIAHLLLTSIFWNLLWFTFQNRRARQRAPSWSSTVIRTVQVQGCEHYIGRREVNIQSLENAYIWMWCGAAPLHDCVGIVRVCPCWYWRLPLCLKISFLFSNHWLSRCSNISINNAYIQFIVAFWVSTSRFV
jgi:hypothetical protein